MQYSLGHQPTVELSNLIFENLWYMQWRRPNVPLFLSFVGHQKAHQWSLGVAFESGDPC